MKLLIGVMLLVLSTLIGYKLSEKYVLRKKFYKDFLTFNQVLTREISFMQGTIVSLVKGIDFDGDFTDLLNYYINTGEFKFEKKYLSSEEIEYLKKYLKIIGSGDKKTQLEFLGSVNFELNNKCATVNEDEKKYKTLYIKLGFLIGLIAMIILL